jgi:hypothetical protein
MATHNTAEGTGGMDGSIRFPEEQARAEVLDWYMYFSLMLMNDQRTLATDLLTP